MISRNSTSSEEASPIPEGWEACASGEISQMLGRLNAARTRRRMLLAGACTTGVVALGTLASVWRLLPTRVQEVADISCSQALEQIDAYFAGTLDSDLTASIAQHLERCRHCRETYQQHEADDSRSSQSSTRRSSVSEAIAFR